MPEAVIIAGANGAGKTTLARRMLPLAHPDCIFINADEIQREQPALSHPVAAGREMLRRLNEMVDCRRSFAIETTMSSRMYAQRIPAWKELGYTVLLYFIEVPDADYAVKRVAMRVRAGGHDIPEADIRRRYERGLDLYESRYRQLADVCYRWRATNEGAELVEEPFQD